MIRRVGKKCVLFTHDGRRRLGTHDTCAKAKAQERAIFASKRRRGLGEAAQNAPAIRFETALRNDSFGIDAFNIDGARVGTIDVFRAGSRTHEGPMAVKHIRVSQQRQGLGTKLYERAARIACERYLGPLESDVDRTAYSQGFWEKQVAKGRARCVTRCLPGDEACPTGEAHATKMRGGCAKYRLPCPAPRTLAGRR